ncbi:MAG TPA: DUF1552 domain-containing protein, partial [Candidatus Nanopelagicales bacterium]|nr:DUF1552 domain-containing protein [Candidatus Nanopelagicales bacterium]
MNKRISKSRRGFLKALGGAALALPFVEMLRAPRAAHANNVAKRVIFFYFPDGMGMPGGEDLSQNWHPSGSEFNFNLSKQLDPLAALKDKCVFIRGLSMGPSGAGSHPEGARKLLTGVDGGNGISIDQYLANSVGAQSPWRHLYLGAMSKVNKNTPRSADSYVTYVAPGQSIVPEDDPGVAFQSLFGSGGGQAPGGGEQPVGPDPRKVSVIDGVLADINALKGQLGDVEKAKLDMHLESAREVEQRIKGVGTQPTGGTTCDEPAVAALSESELYTDAKFPDVLRAQIDLMVLAMSCGLTKVGTIQGSYHTSELIMSRFPNTEMSMPNFDMRSHQASHYGNPGDQLFTHFKNQRRWWVSQFAYLLEQLKSRPDGDGTMLDTSLVVLCSEVSDGNTHSHDNMGFVLAGGAGGAISTGRLLQYNNVRHSNLLSGIAHAMGQPTC